MSEIEESRRVTNHMDLDKAHEGSNQVNHNLPPTQFDVSVPVQPKMLVQDQGLFFQTLLNRQSQTSIANELKSLGVSDFMETQMEI
ncbi:hypothetical protein F3Y22_tig00116938pilonHSYRG00068 [Hibiscus syriacus]|uniref:Uncharacterized protein n=1 Tax=Hibiscus syriacus TaxID=106335 RepID=A0A6A2WMM3_HIBSY|nr:hypothetical protein F3Y22_tig00116938pilonHSYRG00068 [Hibiscus syriacus]